MFLAKMLTPKPERPICPWSARPLNLLSSDFRVSPSHFPRSGHALPPTATAAGKLFFFGGIVPNSGDSACNDLYVFSTRDLSVTCLKTSGDVPSPRFGHAGALIGDDLLIWGGVGVTNTGDKGELREQGPHHDDSLYLLNLGTLDLMMSSPTIAD